MMLKTTRSSTLIVHIPSLGKAKGRGEGGEIALVDQVMKLNPAQPYYESHNLKWFATMPCAPKQCGQNAVVFMIV